MDEVFEQYLAGFISEGELAEARRLSLAGKIKRKVSSAVSLVKGKIKLKTGSIKTHPVTSSNVKEVGYKPGKDNLGELYNCRIECTENRLQFLILQKISLLHIVSLFGIQELD
jgi:hypothetical protein